MRPSHPPSTELGLGIPSPSLSNLVLRERECEKFMEDVTAVEVGIASSLSSIFETTELPQRKGEIQKEQPSQTKTKKKMEDKRSGLHAWHALICISRMKVAFWVQNHKGKNQ